MSWELHILGANSAVPTRNRYPSSQVLDTGRISVLIDCGEGSQIRMLEQGVKRSKIMVICISHLHGDHVFGLPGLLSTYNLYSREERLIVIGPVGLRDFVQAMVQATGHEFVFPFEFIEMDHTGSEVIYEDEQIQISAFPLIHRIPTYGYRINEKMSRVYLNKQKVKEFHLSVHQIQDLLDKEWVDHEGERMPLSFFQRHREAISYAYVSDTQFFESCANYVEGVTAMYHEATFLNQDEVLAFERYHSTARQAALIAQSAKCHHLLIGHFSSRYTDLSVFQQEAEEVFASVFLAKSGKRFSMQSDGRVKLLS